MSFSISSSTKFSDINWDTLENRPTINESMTFCEEKDWDSDSKCCMDGYSIEHVLDVAHENDLWNMPEVKFLDEYPCVNGLELDSLAEEIAYNIPESDTATEQNSWATTLQPQINQSILSLVEQLKKIICSE